MIHAKDNELSARFRVCQDEYLKNGSKSAWSEMWEIALEVAAKIIRIERNKRHFFIDDARFYDVKVDAVERVMRRYKNEGGYFIQYIFSTIRLGVVHALYYRNEQIKFNSKIIFFGDYEDVLVDGNKNSAV